MADLSINVETDIHAPIDKVFDFLLEPAKHVGIMPGLSDVCNLPQSVAQDAHFDFTYHMYGVSLKGNWTVTQLHYPDTYEAETKGDITSHWKYTLTPKEKGTHLNLVVSYHPPQSVVSKLEHRIVRRINEKAAERFLDNIKLILEPIS